MCYTLVVLRDAITPVFNSSFILETNSTCYMILSQYHKQPLGQLEDVTCAYYLCIYDASSASGGYIPYVSTVPLPWSSLLDHHAVQRSRNISLSHPIMITVMARCPPQSFLNPVGPTVMHCSVILLYDLEFFPTFITYII